MSKKGGQKKKVAYIAEMTHDEEDAIKLDLFPNESQNHNLGAFPGIGGGRSTKQHDEGAYGYGEDVPASGIICISNDGIHPNIYIFASAACFIGMVVSAVSSNFESCEMEPFAGSHTNIVLAAQVVGWLWLTVMCIMDKLGIDTLVPLSTRFCIVSFLAGLALLGATLSFGKINGNSVAICMDEDTDGGCTKFVPCEYCECFADGGECVVMSEAGEVESDGLVHETAACTTYQAGVFLSFINAGVLAVVSVLAFRIWNDEAGKPPAELVHQLASLTRSEIKTMQGRTYSTVSTNSGNEGLQNTNPDDDTML